MIQLYYKQPIIIGPLGERMWLLKWENLWYNPVRLVERDSGNQTYFTIENTFSNLNFMSLYLNAVQWDHNFEGVFSPEFHLCENWIERNHGVRGVYGTISDANRGINASGLQYMAPENVYWGIVPELKHLQSVSYRFCLRGNYLNTPDTQRFSVKGSLILF
jgi:hypothetical protein